MSVNKLNSSNTITIKINGEKKPFLEEPSNENPRSDENIIEQDELFSIKEDQEAIVETAAAQEAEESFDWILPKQGPNPNELSLYNAVNSPKPRKSIRLPALLNMENRNIGQIKSLALSVVFAILLGTGFGIVMLKLVITDNSKHTAVEKNATVASNKAQTAEKKETPANNSKAQGAVITKSLTSYMVQGGVYSKKETASAVASQQVEKGIPAEVMEWNHQYYIFLGVADSLEQSKSLGSFLKDQGADGVYSKTITIPEKKLSNLTPDEKKLIDNGTLLVPLLANLSSKPLTGGAISSNELKSLSTFKTKLSEINSKGITNKKIKNLDTEITAAIKQINDYQQKKDHKLLEKAQQHILSFLTDYYSL